MGVNVDGADPFSEAARERANDIEAEILVMPPDSNPPLPFVTWPVPPKDMGN